MRHAICALLSACAVAAGALAAAPAAPTAAAPQLPPGKALFDRWCAECHSPGHGHPGTQQLERLRGAKLAELESRPDMDAAFIRYVVRNGQNAMPAYRPSEISDAGVDQIAQYLGRNAPPAKKQR
ncbi:MAG TPA: cytochrome c [Steroidobacteraceae bacterium]|nr:cytochrome c [Steroidobacteraceae bacterium]